MKRIFTLTALLCLFMMMGINAAVAQSKTATFDLTSGKAKTDGIYTDVSSGLVMNIPYTTTKNDNNKDVDHTSFYNAGRGWRIYLDTDGWKISNPNSVKVTKLEFTNIAKSGGGLNKSSLNVYDGNKLIGTATLIKDNETTTISLTSASTSNLDLKFSPDSKTTASEAYIYFSKVTVTYEVTSTTTIKSPSEMTKSTTVPTTWDFSDVTSSKWTNTVSVLNNTSEWKKAESSNEWRPTTVCSDREYNLELINGLIFNTITSDGLCLDNENQVVSMEKGSSITIPGLKSGNCVRIKGTNVQGITTPDNADLISSGGNEYLFKVTSDGNTKFVFPSSLTIWGVWIQSIEVLASAPVNKTTILISDLDIENNKSANYGFDRQVAGFNIDFAGGQGLKSYNDGTNGNGTYIQLRHYTDKDGKTSDGSIKVSAVDPTVKITKLRFNLDNTNGNSADEQLSFDAAGGNIENKIEGDHAQITDLSAQGWSGITLSYKGTDGSKGIHIKSIEIETDKPVSSEAVTPVLSQALQLVDKNGSKTIDGGISSGDNANWLYSGKFTLTSSNTSIATCNGNTIKGVGTGTATITVNYTPTNSSYFNAVTSTFTIRVRGDAVTQKVWIFDKTLANSDNKGIGNGQNFFSDLWSDTKVTDLDDKTKTYSAKSFKKTIINDDEPITVDGSTPVYGTDGLRFTTSLTDNLVVIPDHGLRIDENGAIVIRDVMPTVTKTDKTEVPTYILIDARPIEGRAGFKVDRGNSNCDFYNELFTSSTSRQTFMLKVDQSNANAIDVTLFPSSDMEIYKIEVTQKKVPVITPTVTGAGSDTENYTVNNNDPFSVKFNVEGGAKGTVNAYSISQVAKGDAVSSTNGEVTFKGLAANGGDAVIVAQFVPSSDENIYTYGLSTVVINVSDKTMYRAKKGDQPTVGHWVETVPGIKMQFGGWKGAPDAPAEYRSDGTADKWGKAKKEAYIDTYPGFDYTFSANENSACETQWQYMNPNFSKSSGVPYWYDEKNIPNNPYMMPVFGGFLKFVPSKNGTLEVYIHQNGVICTITRKNGNQEFNPHMMHIRSYYIADETGKLCTDGVTAETLAKPNEIWNGSNGKEGLYTGYGNPSNDPDDKTNYNTDIPFYQKDYDYFKEKYGSEAPSTAQDIYNLQGGWVMLNEGASKYSFHVTAGKTYFVFTNRTKLGFYGFRFTPDENVTEVTITPSAEGATSYTLTKSSEKAAGSSVAYKVDPSFKRELNAGMWNTLCLPFSLNEDQTKAALPEGFEIVDFYSVKNDKLTFKKHYYQMIDAGRPYLIWIPGTLGEKYDMKFPTGTTGYVAYDDKTSGLKPINVNGEDDSADKYVWTGTYQQMSLPENAYFVAQNPDNGKTVIKQNVSGKSQTKGYRAYLVAASGVITPVKALSIDYDGVDEEVTTGIDDIMADLTDPETTGKVYNLGGQLVSRNGLQSLPKGIYIMNGKKYVVK